MLTALSVCIDAIRPLDPADRRRLLSALTAVLDLTEPQPAPRPAPAPVPEQEPTLYSPHFACSPEDVPEQLEEPDDQELEQQEETPARPAPKGRGREQVATISRRMHNRRTQKDRVDEKLRKLHAIVAALQASTVPLTPSEIAQQTGLETGIVSHRLREMHRDGELVRTGPRTRGAYQLPSASPVQTSSRGR
jgi:hypothetical protein